MIYTFKNYSEVFKRKIPSLPIDELSQSLRGQSRLGNFVSQVGNLFNVREIYDLKKEIDFISKFEITDSGFSSFIDALNSAYEFINYSVEFLDLNKIQDLYLFSLVKANNQYYLKVYELERIAPLLLTEDDLKAVYSQFDAWKYEKISTLLFYSQGFISSKELWGVRDELQRILDQKLVSSQSLRLVEFLMSAKSDKRKESFMVLEKYLSVYQ